jgi:hypothetical protein
MKKLVILLAATLVWSLVPGISGAAKRPCFEVADGSKRGPIEADVDGDELSDRVWLKGRRVTKWCRWHIVINSSAFGTIRKRVKPVDDYERWVLKNGAGPVALVKIDSVPGHEIALQLARGAAVEGVGLFTLRDGIVRRMSVTGPGAPLNDVLLYGGSGSGIHATDCWGKESDLLVSSHAHPGRRKWWKVKRRWYVVQGTEFVKVATHRATVLLERIPRRFDEFADGAAPFANCEGVTIHD